MAELTIAQLTELLAASVDNADLLPIWDDTAAETKKITISQFRTAVGVSNWAESFSSATQATSRWIPSNAATNVNAAIVPKGTGAITAAIPDGTATGGNARGQYAVDFQMARTAANQVASSNFSVIGGGYRNLILGQFTTSSTISGGDNNQINAVNGNHFIGGGIGNQILNNNNEGNCVIAGGLENQVRSGFSVISGGRFNDTNNAPQYYQVIGGGYLNNTSAQNATISGGNTNTASGSSSTISGGASNTASGGNSVVSGGSSNLASADNSSVGGGSTNTASGTAAKIGGGTSNLSQVYKGFVGGGGTNTANAFGSVGGGFTNITNSNVALGTVSVTLTAGSSNIPNGAISATASPIGALITGSGIADNTFISNYAPPNLSMSNNATASGATTLSFWSVGGTVSGGRSNTATGLYAAITGGQGNTASSNHTFVGGGQSNTVSGASTASWSLICGGFGNGVSGNYDVIVGGRSNSISGTNNGNHRFIGGGSSNSMGEQGLYSIIVGGETNSIFGRNNFIGGGASNVITSATYSVMVGGGNHSMTGGNSYMTISGGQSNTTSAAYANVSGGQSNTVSGTHGSVGGGSTNTVSATFGMISGGANAVSSLYGQLSYAAGRFAANGDAQAHSLVWRRSVTGTAQTELFLDGTSVAAILPATNCVWNGIIEICAICTVTGNGTTVVGDVSANSYKITIKRLNTTTSLVGTVKSLNTNNDDPSMNNAVFTFDANDTNESLRVQFTPPTSAGTTTVIRVVARFIGTQIQY